VVRTRRRAFSLGTVHAVDVIRVGVRQPHPQLGRVDDAAQRRHELRAIGEGSDFDEHALRGVDDEGIDGRPAEGGDRERRGEGVDVGRGAEDAHGIVSSPVGPTSGVPAARSDAQTDSPGCRDGARS